LKKLAREVALRSTRTPIRNFGAAIAATLMLAGAADAATLVVRASGPSSATYPPGKMLADTARILLKANDELVLLDAKGTRTLRGPGNFSSVASASAETSGGGTALAALVDQRSDRRVRIGAVRSVDGTAKRPPNIWYIDASRGGTVCVADAAQAMLWRPDPDNAGSTTASPATGTPAKIDWGSGQAVQPWPQALPLTEGAQYKLMTGSAAPAAIKVTLVGTPPEELQDMAQVLITHGCTAQLDLLVATTSAADAAGR
jgi:hypothetical protein